MSAAGVRRALGFVAGLAILAPGCAANGGERPPASLVDGSAARPPPVELEGVRGPTVLARATRHSVGRVPAGSPAGSCLAAFGGAAHGVVVDEVGVHGASLTFRDGEGRSVHSCDRVGARWCAWVSGRLDAGRLRDPRATLSCRDGDRPVGFLWVEPSRAASYVVVAHDDFAEAHAVWGKDRRVRVSASRAELESATVQADVSEHARDGRRLHSYVVEASVAG